MTYPESIRKIAFVIGLLGNQMVYLGRWGGVMCTSSLVDAEGKKGTGVAGLDGVDEVGCWDAERTKMEMEKKRKKVDRR